VLQKALLTVRVLWLAISMSIAVFLVVLALAAPPGPSQAAPVMAPVLVGVAVLLAVMSVVLPRTLHWAAVSSVELPVITEADPEGFGSFYREAAPTRNIIADREAAHQAAVKCFQPAYIIGLALSEAIALLGFVLGFLGFAPWIWLPFFAVGFVLVAIRFPTERKIVAPLEAALGVKIADPGGQS